jgi:transcription initiation factor IIE alpha subunit
MIQPFIRHSLQNKIILSIKVKLSQSRNIKRYYFAIRMDLLLKSLKKLAFQLLQDIKAS